MSLHLLLRVQLVVVFGENEVQREVVEGLVHRLTDLCMELYCNGKQAQYSRQCEGWSLLLAVHPSPRPSQTEYCPILLHFNCMCV